MRQRGVGPWAAGFFLLVLAGMCMSPHESSSSAPASYSSQDYSTPTTSTNTESAAGVQEWFYIHGDLNVRAEPSTTAAIVRTLQRGDFVQLGPSDANGWARLYTPGSGEGYVYRASGQVRSEAPAARETAESTSRSVSAYSGGGGSRRSSGGRVYHTGPRGGCYYINSSGNKQYVNRSHCN